MMSINNTMMKCSQAFIFEADLILCMVIQVVSQGATEKKLHKAVLCALK